MDEHRPYKFFHNGYSWWLRIEDTDTLLRWVEDSDSMWAKAFKDALQSNTPTGRHNSDQLGSAIINLARMSGNNLICETHAIRLLSIETKYNYLCEKGFININPVGGFNSIDWPMLQVEYRDKLVFPHYSERDIRIETFKPVDYREGYQYHYYAYIGNLQVKDGDVVKWDSYDEAMAVAKRYIEK